jgi:hypothetical protein
MTHIRRTNTDIAAVFTKAILTAALAATLSGHAGQAQTTSANNPLVGTWTLASYSNKDAQGNEIHPWGSKPVGAYMFGPDGYFLETIINEEKADASVDYFGTYTVEDGKILKLHIINCTAPQFRGKDLQREITLSDNRFSTRNPNPSVGGGTVTITWQRVK